MSGHPHNHYDDVKVTDAAQSTATQAQAEAEAKAYQDFDKALGGDPNQYTVIPDPDHSDLARLKFLADDRAMNIFQKHGFKRIGLERPGVFQKDADDLAAGRISDNEFVERMKKKMVTNFQSTPQEIDAFHRTTAKMIVNAYHHGIKIDFLDVDYKGQNEGIKALRLEEKELAKRMQPYAGLDPDSPEYRNIYAQMKADYEEKEVGVQRMKGDRKVTVPHIKEVTGKDKTAIYYGKKHIDENITRGLATSTAQGQTPNAFNQGKRGVTEIELGVTRQDLESKPNIDVRKLDTPNALATRLVMPGP